MMYSPVRISLRMGFFFFSYTCVCNKQLAINRFWVVGYGRMTHDAYLTPYALLPTPHFLLSLFYDLQTY